ncbi:hypothetical protein [Palleronia sp. LCG004]|uniref:hypothetical protein n=1 Tax=Palleronia sp. LCG004 TaxID=3079304 RepID=UPI002943045B|nr:hypothetical protein [Palleronia sp. LCG004]WOI56405.1 hypothetical protein RVY76_01010 [Palleronia sp. LCG004]
MIRLRSLAVASLIFGVLAGAASAECYADYKAKRDDPLRLHYGVIRLSDSECADPSSSVARRIASDGWELLTVMQVFDRAAADRRRSDAGNYFLRY